MVALIYPSWWDCNTYFMPLIMTAPTPQTSTQILLEEPFPSRREIARTS